MGLKLNKKPRLLLSTKASAILLSFFIIIGIIGGVMIPIGWESRQNAISTLNGELNPFRVNAKEPFRVAFSPETGMNFTYQQLSEGISLSDLWTGLPSDDLKINFDKNNNLLISAKIRNSNGTLVGIITNNNWQLSNPDELLYVDRNYNSFAFEIIGIDNFPTFQVMMVGSNEIQIGGLFYTTDHGSIYFQIINSYSGWETVYYPDGTVVVQQHRNSDMYLDESEEFLAAKNIPTIFKYPALTNASNVGKLAIPFTHSSDPLIVPTFEFGLGISMFIIGSVVSYFALESYSYQKTKEKREKR